jgi:DNA-binding NtrC family response regulator
MYSILIAEDEDNLCRNLVYLLRQKNFYVVGVNNGKLALEKIENRDFDLVVADLKMPELDGMSLLTEIRKRSLRTKVIIITAFGSIENAVLAMKKGAYDYLAKPFSLEEFELRVEKALESVRLRNEKNYLMEVMPGFSEIVGEDEKIKELFNLIKKIAPMDSTVLITGETGTGKELVARAIHHLSPRREKPLIVAHCSAYAPSLLESELFGHEKGAFTGAVSTRVGRFELADGSTLFLDEIGDISPEVQIKLLRVIETHRFSRVGGNVEFQSNFRLITATNKDLKELVKEGKFREDLYWRLNVIPIHLPPLRERKEDIPRLISFFLEKYRKSFGLKEIKIDDRVLALLVNYHWPGNVRELQNTIERAAALSGGGMIKYEHLFIETGEKKEIDAGKSLEELVEEFEKNLIKQAYQKTGYVQTETAKLLGINRATLQYKLKKYGLSP